MQTSEQVLRNTSRRLHPVKKTWPPEMSLGSLGRRFKGANLDMSWFYRTTVFKRRMWRGTGRVQAQRSRTCQCVPTPWCQFSRSLVRLTRAQADFFVSFLRVAHCSGACKAVHCMVLDPGKCRAGTCKSLSCEALCPIIPVGQLSLKPVMPVSLFINHMQSIRVTGLAALRVCVLARKPLQRTCTRVPPCTNTHTKAHTHRCARTHSLSHTCARTRVARSCMCQSAKVTKAVQLSHVLS